MKMNKHHEAESILDVRSCSENQENIRSEDPQSSCSEQPVPIHINTVQKFKDYFLKTHLNTNLPAMLTSKILHVLSLLPFVLQAQTTSSSLISTAENLLSVKIVSSKKIKPISVTGLAGL
jgi:hypothetical protein